MEAICHPMRAWREKNGVSLRAMAARLEAAHGGALISHVSLGRIERGVQPPSIEVIRAVALVTGGAVGADPMVAGYRPATAAAEGGR